MDRTSYTFAAGSDDELAWLSRCTKRKLPKNAVRSRSRSILQNGLETPPNGFCECDYIRPEIERMSVTFLEIFWRLNGFDMCSRFGPNRATVLTLTLVQGNKFAVPLSKHSEGISTKRRLLENKTWSRLGLCAGHSVTDKRKSRAKRKYGKGQTEGKTERSIGLTKGSRLVYLWSLKPVVVR